MTKYLRSLGEYNKALVATAGGVGATASALLGLGDVLPAPVSAALVSVAAASTAVAVYLVKNQTVVDELGDHLADLLDR